MALFAGIAIEANGPIGSPRPDHSLHIIRMRAYIVLTRRAILRR